MDCHQCSSKSKSSACGQSRLSWPLWGKRKQLQASDFTEHYRLALVGMPNVGKSVLFNALTGVYVTVSNYPGTTVEVSSGRTMMGRSTFTVVDTPGFYSLVPITEEEKVTRDVLLTAPPDLVIHVVDAKNLGRMLLLTVQLIEAGLPVLLVVNMIDEAQRLGIHLEAKTLEAELGIPVVPMAATSRLGLAQLQARILEFVQQLAPSAIAMPELQRER